MSIDRVRKYLEGLPCFLEEYDELTRNSILAEFPSIIPHNVLSELDWNYLLLCASIFAKSDQKGQQEIALRIADTCFKLCDKEGSEVSAAAIILDMMANQRGAALAVNREIISSDWERELPISLRGDLIKRHSEDVINDNESSLPVNRFQKKFWTALENSSAVSASAPTSAGKSFILREWLANFLRRASNACVVIVVPTRALIQEFVDELNGELLNGKFHDTEIQVLPLARSIREAKRTICVFTQERLHILLSQDDAISFDLIIVDEAQKIGDGHRGVLLQQVLSECYIRNPRFQVIYASPFSENPEYLFKYTPDLTAQAVKVEVTTVTQNLLFLDQQPRKPTTWNVTYRASDKIIELGSVNLAQRATSSSKRLSMPALALSSEKGGNLIYTGGAAEAEKIARQISAALSQAAPPNSRLRELIKLVKKTVHTRYALADVLKNGVAYHYGNMPMLIRTEIEGLFKDNVIKFLVCTGTLIEGVNLPCKNIFMRRPTKGLGIDMEDSDFWNLAGRAGRWGHEFQGSIICVDTRAWRKPPPVSRSKYQIQSTLDKEILKGGEILRYIEEGYPPEKAKNNPHYDYVVSYLMSVMCRDGNLEEIAGFPENIKDRIEGIFEMELSEFPMPESFIFRHPGITADSMLELLRALEKMPDNELISLAPTLPDDLGAVDCYIKIFHFINNYLKANWASGEVGGWRLKQLGVLCVDWMRGKPLAVLISNRYNKEGWKDKRGYKSKNLSTTIIGVMKDVEEFARFRIPKYLRAFMDILYFHAEERGLQSAISMIPELELWLEFGVSTKTQLAFMELGLSRTSAIEIMEFLVDTELNKEAALKWLLTANWESFDLPGAIIEEVRKVFQKYGYEMTVISE